MPTYINKKHRVKKTDRGYLPQWKAGDNGKYHQDFDECMPGLIR